VRLFVFWDSTKSAQGCVVTLPADNTFWSKRVAVTWPYYAVTWPCWHQPSNLIASS